MQQVFLIIKDEGEYSQVEWQIKRVCSSFDDAVDMVIDETAKDYLSIRFRQNEYVSPFFIETWSVDSEKPMEPVVAIGMEQVAKKHAAVGAEIRKSFQFEGKRE